MMYLSEIRCSQQKTCTRVQKSCTSHDQSKMVQSGFFVLCSTYLCSTWRKREKHQETKPCFFHSANFLWCLFHTDRQKTITVILFSKVIMLLLWLCVFNLTFSNISFPISFPILENLALISYSFSL